ncbi:MAG: site-2 protease family protein [Phycisphaerales bacterium]|nr:MAG: site-2 protease family protein [Phycisphaerales bacterium]
MNWWVHYLYQEGRITELLSWAFWVIFSITMHELAHGWAAIRQGDDTPRRLGRMTMNPLVHMGPWSLLMFALIGIAWGAMPVDPSRFRNRRQGRIFVSAAGPAMNIVLSFITLTMLIPWLAFGPQNTPVFYQNVTIFLWTGGWLNIVLALFNLLPIPPLDGSSILSGLSFRAYQFYQNPRAQMIGMFLVLVVFLTGCFSIVFAVCGAVAGLYVDLGSMILGGPSVFDVIRP